MIEPILMSEEYFSKVLAERLQTIEMTLGIKAKEYVRNGDRMHNFNATLGVLGANVVHNAMSLWQSREKAIWGFALKHFVSVQDLVNESHEIDMYASADFAGDARRNKAIIGEKIGDLINYLILLESSLYHTYDDQVEHIAHRRRINFGSCSWFTPGDEYLSNTELEAKHATFLEAESKKQQAAELKKKIRAAKANPKPANNGNGKFVPKSKAKKKSAPAKKRK